MSRTSNIDLKNKQESCFAYSDKGCRATLKTDCKNCTFYKSKQQYQEDLNKSERYIEEKYKIPYKTFIEIKGLC